MSLLFCAKLVVVGVGGAPNISNGFVAGLMWLDKLQLSAGFGLHFAFRQEFICGRYESINS